MDFAFEIAKLLNAANDALSAEEYEALFETPPERALGDYALPCFKLARTMRKAPPMIAASLKEAIDAQGVPAYLSRVECVGGYLNFFLDRENFARTTLEKIAAEGDDYGKCDEGRGRVVCLDYSSINIAKPFHIGHLSSTVIGNSLYRIYNFIGYKSVGINHLGDWGTQFGKLIVAYKKWGDEKTIERDGVRALLDIYVRFHNEAERDESLNEEARAWFLKIEQGDPEAMRLFDWFREITLREVARVYDLLDVHFDSYAGESFYNDKMDRVIDELTEKFPVSQPILGEQNQKDFIKLYGNILRLKNILSTFDCFAGNELLPERTFQDYQSIYIDLYQQYRPKADENKENINDDIEFEVELIR